MLNRSLARVVILVVAAAAVLLSCGIDYSLDFGLDTPTIDGETVSVDYTMTNSGTYDMEDVALNIMVSINGGESTLEQWTAAGVDLITDDGVTGSITFTFSGYSIGSATATVIGVRWDRSTSME